ncbi:MAG: hypothetical protein ABR576_07045 [Thermoanaerobaculia bacterium]
MRPTSGIALCRVFLLACAIGIPACRAERTATGGTESRSDVRYRCEGFAGPIEKQMEIPRGRTLPLKAQLLDAAGKPVSAEPLDPPPAIRLVRLDGGTETDSSDIAAAGDFGKAGKFVFRESFWKFDLDTADFPELGTYRAELVSGDGSRYRIESPCAVTFILKE